MKRVALLPVLPLLLVATLVYWTGRGGQAPAAVEPESAHAPLLPPAKSTRVALPPQATAIPCRIDGVVLRRAGNTDTPIADAEVLLEQDEDPGQSSPGPGMAQPDGVILARAQTRADGIFAFEGLAGKSDTSSTIRYRLRARVAGGAEREALVRVSERDPCSEARLVFGSARIHGTLRGIDGAPLERASVRLEAQDDAAGTAGVVRRATGASGEYAFDALVAGKYLVCIPASERRGPVDGSPACRWTVQLAEGEDIALDAGSPGGTPYWRGMIRSCAGDLLTGKMTIAVQRHERFPLGSEATAVLAFEIQAEHGFDLRLDVADWTPQVTIGGDSASKGATWKARDPMHVGPLGICENLVMGPRLEGRVFVQGTGLRLQGCGGGKLLVRLYKPGQPESSPEHSTAVDEYGAFDFAMLAEGDWVVRTWPRDLATPDKQLAIHLANSELVHRIDLRVEVPVQ